MCKQILGLVAACFAMLTLSTANAAATDAGIVLAASGDATAKGDGGAARKLERRSAINAGDTVVTGAGGTVQLRMKDGTVLALGEGSEFAVSSYSSKAAGDTQDSATLKLVKGSLMQVSGNMEKSAYSLETPVSTLGIRGTVFNVVVNADGSVTATVSQGAVASASIKAVESAKVALDTRKAKAKKARKDYEEALAAGITGDRLAKLKQDAEDAETEADAAQTSFDNAVADATNLIDAGNALNTDGEGNNTSTDPVTFTLDPATLAKLVSANDSADAASIVGDLVKAFPELRDEIVAAAIEGAPSMADAINQAADDATSSGDGFQAPGDQTIVDQLNQQNDSNTTTGASEKDGVSAP